MKYDSTVDAASAVVRGPIEPGGDHHKERLDQDRFVRYRDSDEAVIEYEFLNVKRFGVRLDDLPDRDELSTLFREAGFSERYWSTPSDAGRVIRRRDRAVVEE